MGVDQSLFQLERIVQIRCVQVVHGVSTVGALEFPCRLPFYPGQILSAHKSSSWGTCLACSGHLGQNRECCSIFTVVCGHQALSNRMRFGGVPRKSIFHLLTQVLSSFLSVRAGCLKEGCILEIFLEKYMKWLFFDILNVTLPFPSICVLLLYCLPVLESGDQHILFQV